MNQDRTNPPSSLPRPDFFSEALRRAGSAAVSRPARRTFAEMLPGATRPPVLHLAPNVRFLPTAVWGDTEPDVCPLCERWSCICGQSAHAPACVSVKAVA